MMMATINKTHFGGRQVVTCFSCHRGTDRPKVTPNLATLYGAPPPEDPRDVIEQARTRARRRRGVRQVPRPPSAAPRARPRSRASRPPAPAPATGPTASRARSSCSPRRPISATTIVRSAGGDRTTVFDGRAGWLAAPHRPVPVLALAGADLDGLRIDAELAFPSRIKQIAGTVAHRRGDGDRRPRGAGGAGHRQRRRPRDAVLRRRDGAAGAAGALRRRRRSDGCRRRSTTPTIARWPA